MPALISQDIKSYVIEGFEISVEAIFDEKANTETLQQLMAK